MDFSNEEKRDIVKIYYKNDRNSVKTSEMYLNMYPERRQPHRTLFKLWDRNLAEFGSFEKRRQKYGDRMDEETKENLVNEINMNPGKSTRQIFDVTDASSHTSAWRQIRKSGYKCYKINISQKLHPGDPERRLEFCDWIQRRPDFPAFLENVIWTDESTFTNCGIFNRKNEHIWSINNPRQFRELRPQVRFSVNVWAGIYKNKILGPHFFNGNLNGETYYQFLTTTFEDYLDDLPLANYNNIWFQHDGAPPHNTRQVSDYLTERFGVRWIGNNGPVKWPARSPDLSVLDTFLWGTLKNRIYGGGEYQNLQELQLNIIREFGRLRRREINRAVHNIQRRVEICLENQGQHFEHLL